MAQETGAPRDAGANSETTQQPAPQPTATVAPQPAPQPATQPAAQPAATAAAPRVSQSPLPIPADEAAPVVEEEDSYGVMYLRLQGGLSYANLLSFNQDNFIPEAEESSGLGPFGGLAVGFRVYWFSIGANATFGRQGGFDLGTVGAELAFHIPIPTVQPYVRLAAGYAWVGRYDFQSQELEETDIYGLTVEAGAGIDIKIARHLSIGAGVDAAFLNLTRQEVGSETRVRSVTDVDLDESGDALGFQLRAHLHLTIHI
ncbi:MAG: hypothetical protein ACI9KE_003144 [Polyangiales bacterium]|jgi:hypothetical protein